MLCTVSLNDTKRQFKTRVYFLEHVTLTWPLRHLGELQKYLATSGTARSFTSRACAVKPARVEDI